MCGIYCSLLRGQTIGRESLILRLYRTCPTYDLQAHMKSHCTYWNGMRFSVPKGISPLSNLSGCWTHNETPEMCMKWSYHPPPLPDTTEPYLQAVSPGRWLRSVLASGYRRNVSPQSVLGSPLSTPGSAKFLSAAEWSGEEKQAIRQRDSVWGLYTVVSSGL